MALGDDLEQGGGGVGGASGSKSGLLKGVTIGLGGTGGSGGTAGAAYLRKMLEVELFPELWRVRTEL